MFKNPVKKICFTVIACIVIYAAACGYLYLRQNRILFPGSHADIAKKYTFKNKFDEVWIDSGDAKLHGLYFYAGTGSPGGCKAQEAEMTKGGKASAAVDVEKHRRYRTTQPADGQNASTHTNPCGSGSISPKGMIIFFHGNTEMAEQFGKTSDEFTAQGYDYFIPDYRGYGKSSGKISSESQFLGDIDNIFAWAKKKYPENKIVLAGRSMGAVPAVYLGSKSKPRCVVMIAPFFNIAAMARIRYPLLPKSLVRYQLRNDLWIQQVKSPVYLIHGTRDKTIPYVQSEQLAVLVKAKRKRFIIPGAGHSNLQDFTLYHQVLFYLMSDKNR